MKVISVLREEGNLKLSYRQRSRSCSLLASDFKSASAGADCHGYLIHFV